MFNFFASKPSSISSYLPTLSWEGGLAFGSYNLHPRNILNNIRSLLNVASNPRVSSALGLLALAYQFSMVTGENQESKHCYAETHEHLGFEERYTLTTSSEFFTKHVISYIGNYKNWLGAVRNFTEITCAATAGSTLSYLSGWMISEMPANIYDLKPVHVSLTISNFDATTSVGFGAFKRYIEPHIEGVFQSEATNIEKLRELQFKLLGEDKEKIVNQTKENAQYDLKRAAEEKDRTVNGLNATLATERNASLICYTEKAALVVKKKELAQEQFFYTVIQLGAILGLGIPYILDWMKPSARSQPVRQILRAELDRITAEEDKPDSITFEKRFDSLKKDCKRLIDNFPNDNDSKENPTLLNETKKLQADLEGFEKKYACPITHGLPNTPITIDGITFDKKTALAHAIHDDKKNEVKLYDREVKIEKIANCLAPAILIKNTLDEELTKSENKLKELVGLFKQLKETQQPKVDEKAEPKKDAKNARNEKKLNLPPTASLTTAVRSKTGSPVGAAAAPAARASAPTTRRIANKIKTAPFPTLY